MVVTGLQFCFILLEKKTKVILEIWKRADLIIYFPSIQLVFDNPITLYQTPGNAFKELCDNEKNCSFMANPLEKA